MIHRVLISLITLITASAANAGNHPEWSELAPLLSKPIDDKAVTTFVEKHGLKKSYKFDEGSFSAPDQAYTLMFEKNRISHILLRVSPWPKDQSDAHWTVYSRALPGKLETTDSRKDVVRKLGEPTNPNVWNVDSIRVGIDFNKDDSRIVKIGVSPAPTKP